MTLSSICTSKKLSKLQQMKADEEAKKEKELNAAKDAAAEVEKAQKVEDEAIAESKNKGQ